MSSNNDDNGENDGCGCNKNKRPPNYPVFTNPLDMERFFNQQMNEIVKSFGLFGSFFHGFPEYPSTQNPGTSLDDRIPSENDSGSRDFMLKRNPNSIPNSEGPEYLQPSVRLDSFKLDIETDRKNQKIDSDLDNKGIKSEDLDDLYRQPKEREPNKGVVPFFDHGQRGPGSLFGQMFGINPQFPDIMLRPQVPNDEDGGGNWTTRSYSFSQSSSQSKFQLPDGSMEERTETTDNQGNKINKMKKTTKDGEWYCRTCITKPGGTEECQEESSNNYQTTENDSFSNPIDGGAQGITSWNKSFSYFSNFNRGDTTDNLANEMFEKEKKHREALIEKLKEL